MRSAPLPLLWSAFQHLAQCLVCPGCSILPPRQSYFDAARAFVQHSQILFWRNHRACIRSTSLLLRCAVASGRQKECHLQNEGVAESWEEMRQAPNESKGFLVAGVRDSCAMWTEHIRIRRAAGKHLAYIDTPA